MLFYNLGAILKIISGITILFYLYNYINIYEDVALAMGFGFLGIFMACWGISFYAFYIFQRIGATTPNIQIASKSYKLSLLFGLFIIINLSLIILEKWNKMVSLPLLVIFIILQIFTINEQQ